MSDCEIRSSEQQKREGRASRSLNDLNAAPCSYLQRQNNDNRERGIPLPENVVRLVSIICPFFLLETAELETEWTALN